MVAFEYTARDESGQVVSGVVSAASTDEAARLLRGERKYPVKIRQTGVAATTRTTSAAAVMPRATGGTKITRAELIHLSTQLSIMIETGVTLLDALQCISRQTKSPRYKALTEDLARTVEGGSDFSAAISKHPRSFPRLYISLMRAAERSGMMSKMMLRATAYLRDEQETLRRVKGALTYPAIMLAFAVLTTGFLLAFVLPRFAAIYSSKGAALPLPTRILMTASNVLVHNWVIVLIVTAAAATGGFFFWRSEAGTWFWHTVQLRLPLFGKLFRTLHLSRGLRMMGTLAGSGVNLLDCVENTLEATGNLHYRAMWQDISGRLKQGRPMSEGLAATSLVPGDVAQMLNSGENSGKLASVMEQVATYSESELKEKVTELTRYIEPAMIITMGLIIGGVALALMLPVFTMSRVVAN